MTTETLDRDQLIRDHLGYAYAVAHRSISPHVFGDARDELVADGVEGLVQAARSWSEERSNGGHFRFYAARRVRGAVLDAMRQADPLTRTDRRRFRDGDATAAPPITVSLDALAESTSRREHQPVAATPTPSRSRPELVDAVASLPTIERRVVAMTFGRGMTLAEVGAILGLSESGVCRARQRAIVRLRATVAA